MNNKLFFLIPLLLLIPITVDAYRGSDYEKIVNQDGSITQTINLPPFIHNGTQYIPFIFNDTDTLLQVETNHGSVQLDKSTCKFSFWKNGIINSTSDIRLLGDFIIPYQGTTPTTMSVITQITSQTCETNWNGLELKARKNDPSIGSVEYSFILNNGKWKTELNSTNTSGLNDRYFGFTQTIDLERDVINFGGSQKNLDNYDGTTFDRTFLENNESKVINLLNSFNFDFDLAFDNLNGVTIIDTGANK